MGKIKDEIQIQQQLYIQQKSYIRKTCVERSKEYCLLLGLMSDDSKHRFELLQEQQDEESPVKAYPTMEDLAKSSVINLHGENEDYHLISKHVCMYAYGYDWAGFLMAYSTDVEHNMSNGFGTSLVNVLTEEANQELITLLKE